MIGYALQNPSLPRKIGQSRIHAMPAPAVIKSAWAVFHSFRRIPHWSYISHLPSPSAEMDFHRHTVWSCRDVYYKPLPEMKPL